jgi:MFS transporter, DHA1 family, multidrug resistance protein
VFFNYVGTWMSTPIVSLYSKSVGASVADVGLIMGANQVMAAALSIPFGLVSDRVGRKVTMISGCIASGISYFLLAFVPPQYIMITYMMTGIGSTAYSTISFALIGDLAREGQLGKSFGIYAFFVQTAMVIGPILGGIATSITGRFQTAFLFSGSLLLAGAISGFFILPPKKKERVSNRRNLRQDLEELSRDFMALASIVALFSINFVWGVLVTFLPLYLDSIGIDVVVIGAIFSIHSAVNGVSQIPFGYIYDKTRIKEKLFTAGLILAAAIMLALSLTNNLILLIILVALLGLSRSITHVTGNSIMAKSSGPEMRGLGMGLLSTGIFAGWAMASGSIGAAIDFFNNYGTGFQITSIICLVGIGAIYILKRKKNKHLPNCPI